MQRLVSTTSAQSIGDGLPEDLLAMRLSNALAEIQALHERLGRVGHHIADRSDAPWEDPLDEAEAQDDGAPLPRLEFVARFLSMTVGGALVAAGLTSGLSFGIFVSPTFGASGAAAALIGAALCAGGLLLGRSRFAEKADLTARARS